MQKLYASAVGSCFPRQMKRHVKASYEYATLHYLKSLQPNALWSLPSDLTGMEARELQTLQLGHSAGGRIACRNAGVGDHHWRIGLRIRGKRFFQPWVQLNVLNYPVLQKAQLGFLLIVISPHCVSGRSPAIIESLLINHILGGAVSTTGPQMQKYQPGAKQLAGLARLISKSEVRIGEPHWTLLCSRSRLTTSGLRSYHRPSTSRPENSSDPQRSRNFVMKSLL